MRQASAPALFLLLIGLLCLSFEGYSLMHHFAASLSGRLPLPYTESVVFSQIAGYLEDGVIYGNLEAPPFRVSLYPPTFLVTSAALSWVLEDTLLASRALSLSAFVAICLVTLRLLSSFSESRSISSKRLGLTTGLLVLLSMQPLYDYAGLGVVDLLASAFSFGAFAVAYLCRGRGASLAVILAISFLSALAVWTKQTAVFGVICAHLLLALSFPGRAVGAGVATIGFSAGLGLLYYLSFGEPLFRNLLFAGAAEWHLDRYLLASKAFLARYFPVISLLAVLLVLSLYRPGPSQLENNRWVGGLPFILYAAISYLSFFGIARAGGDWNYLIEFAIALALLTGAATTVCADAFLRDGRQAPLRSSLLIAALATAPFAIAHAGQRNQTASDFSLDDRAYRSDLLALLRQTEGGVYSMDSGLQALSGKGVWGDPGTLSQLSEAGWWDAERITSLLASDQRISCLVDVSPWTFERTPAFARLPESFPEVRELGRYRLLCREGLQPGGAR